MIEHKFSIIPGRAINDPRVTDSIYRTLAALCGYANAKTGWCFPSQETLAQDTGKTRKTINEHLQLLEEWGYVVSGKRKREDNSPTSKRYQVIYDVPFTRPMSSPDYSAYEFPRGYTNDSSNDPSTNTANGENQPLPDGLSVEWQLVAGAKKIVVPDQKEAQIRDAANLLVMGTSLDRPIAYGIAYTFMKERDIVIPMEDIKGNRKPLKKMVDAGVLPNHVMEAVQKMVKDNLTCVDLFSVAKIAIDIANPAKPIKMGTSMEVRE